MQHSMRRFGTDHIDLMQVHNLNDWRTQLDLLREWKATGRLPDAQMRKKMQVFFDSV